MAHTLIYITTPAAVAWLLAALILDIRTQRIPLPLNLCGSAVTCLLAAAWAHEHATASAGWPPHHPPENYALWHSLVGYSHPVAGVLAGAASWAGLYLLVCVLSLSRHRPAGIGGADLVAAPAAGAVAALGGPTALWCALLATQVLHIVWMELSRKATGRPNSAHLPAMTVGVAAALAVGGIPYAHAPP